MEGGRTFALQFQRFTRLNRTLHILMIVSFISLALTGMTLKFSYTDWAAVHRRACWAVTRRPASSTGPRPRSCSASSSPTSGT